MASILRQKYTGFDKFGNKVTKESKHWYVDYKDADGIRRRVKGFTDKGATDQLKAKLERDAAMERAGLIDRFAKHRTRQLSEHLADFKASLINKGDTEKHALLVYQRAKSVIEGGQFRRIPDISGAQVQHYLAERRRNDNLSIRSSNFYLQAIKQLCKWLVNDQRAAENPLNSSNVKILSQTSGTPAAH